MNVNIAQMLRAKIIQMKFRNEIKKKDTLKKISSSNAGWVVPIDLLDEDSIYYCLGVGEDITFDLWLINLFSCQIHAFDPTPRVFKYIRERVSGIKNFNFYNIGLWSSNGNLGFMVLKIHHKFLILFQIFKKQLNFL